MSDEPTERDVEALAPTLWQWGGTLAARALLASDWYAERIAQARREGRPWAACTGAANCPEGWHIHGCHADAGKCDDPRDHHGSITEVARRDGAAEAWEAGYRAGISRPMSGGRPLSDPPNPYRAATEASR